MSQDDANYSALDYKFEEFKLKVLMRDNSSNDLPKQLIEAIKVSNNRTLRH